MTTTHAAIELGPATGSKWHLSRYFERCSRALQECVSARKLRATLYGLQDRELQDIGVTRSEIDHVVLNGSGGRGAFSGDTGMRLKLGRSFAWLSVIVAAGCFIATPADARPTDCRERGQCTKAAHDKKIVRQAGHVPKRARMRAKHGQRVARAAPASRVWHGWGGSFYLDGVRYPGGNPRGPASALNNWEGGFHPGAFWVLAARYSH